MLFSEALLSSWTFTSIKPFFHPFSIEHSKTIESYKIYFPFYFLWLNQNHFFSHRINKSMNWVKKTFQEKKNCLSTALNNSPASFYVNFILFWRFREKDFLSVVWSKQSVVRRKKLEAKRQQNEFMHAKFTKMFSALKVLRSFIVLNGKNLLKQKFYILGGCENCVHMRTKVERHKNVWGTLGKVRMETVSTFRKFWEVERCLTDREPTKL